MTQPINLPPAISLLAALSAVRGEIGVALLAGYAAYFGLSIYAWLSASGRRPLDFIVRPMGWALFWIMVSAALFGLGIIGRWSGVWAWVIIAGSVGIGLWPLVLLASSAAAWRRAARMAVDGRMLRSAWGAAALCGLAVGLPPIGFSLAWALGRLAGSTALLASVLTAAVALGIGIAVTRRRIWLATRYTGEPTIPRSQYPRSPGA